MTTEEFLEGFDSYKGPNNVDPEWVDWVCKIENDDVFDLVVRRECNREYIETYMELRNSPLMKALR